MNDFIFCDSGINETIIVICKNDLIVTRRYYKQSANYIAKVIIAFAKCFNIRDLYIGKVGCDLVIIDNVYMEDEENFLKLHELNEIDSIRLYEETHIIETMLS